MGGYTIEVGEVERAADALGLIAFCASNADGDIIGIVGLPAPAAGDGIGTALGSFRTQWHDVLPDLHTEVDTLAKKVTTSASVTVKVEEEVHGRFSEFTR